MTKKEFIRICMLCGYASKKNAIKYAQNKEVLTEVDFVKVFDINERQNDIKHGILSLKCKSSSDDLINNLSINPKPWINTFDASRRIKRWDKNYY